uniref:Uncharacterized 9.2 kDa protein in rpl23-rpl2 intergenic region n=1 Tax=Euglena longa TaxID=3037 RepID=YCX7_EUGLO|nr:hypothetical protein AsloCp24 [Euglena longa]P34781.1 RecName: Full=Uncharacterized 9.2 kDa protein in rpl23-rpl2 intergenic region; AltName: Full=ORF76 [Euglena longa]CAC24595.1 hypothetical protein [Euglena longa]
MNRKDIKDILIKLLVIHACVTFVFAITFLMCNVEAAIILKSLSIFTKCKYFYDNIYIIFYNIFYCIKLYFINFFVF